MSTRGPARFARTRALAFMWLLATVPSVAAPPDAAPLGPLHVPSPDWRDQVVYFVMTDRFDDGEPRNNDQGAGEYDPRDNARWSGGDLRGVERRIGYIRDLGATAVWITPPVANQWWSERSHYGGYHGYWASDFAAVDAHYGTLEDYRRLSRRLHGAGMYLVQDVVVNHTGNYFTYDGGWDPRDPAAHFQRNAGNAPAQPPFDRNDAHDARQRAEGIYHWTPAIRDYADREQLLNFQLADLDDLNTENPQVRRALRRSYARWIREAGVDAFRVDTAFYVPPDYFDDFLHARDRAAPGIAQVAAQTGRKDFLLFGEGFGVDRPYEDAQMRRIDTYLRDAEGRALLPSMIQFPLYGTSVDVFARGRPTAELAWRIQRTMQLYADPHRMPTFVDNHDVDRFLASGSEAALRQALLAIMTLPGIPVVYYGTEQGFTEQRASMFATGYGSGGHDRFDPQTPLYRYLREAIALRRGDRVFSRGVPTVLRSDAAGPGALAWRMDHEGASALVLLNTAEHPTLMDRVDTGLAPGTRVRSRFTIDGGTHDAVVDPEGRITLVLPARAGWVMQAVEDSVVPQAPSASLDIDMHRVAETTSALDIAGRASGTEHVDIVVDGDVSTARRVPVDRDGRWRARIDTGDMTDAAIVHRVVAWAPQAGVASKAVEFRVQRDWTLLAQHDDAAGDDNGPLGRYTYPLDAGWRDARPADLRRVRVYGAGGALKVEVQVPSLSQAWNAPNGFDHVAFNVFVQLPDAGAGATVMPQQNGVLPDGMHWSVRLRAHGWSNALFSATGATATQEGTPLVPAATLQVDREAATVTFVLPASSLGRPRSFRGGKVYVSTWDYDGGYRPLAPGATASGFGGGDGARDPRVMDDSGVIELR
ncbi:alpha-amylase family glycosyl hydrolase [Lysobacter sp. LF1]|uniref:Alpha-amylase family glycosyl hydrolase n=1 Tax=Lysobacter stagni TaxID=3045172 RepID=A0ABT6XD26_9GAMM|nr:alpha-amylase family glycosyl hydrolase [Lysobacter sp. LF1]MDI9237828.1 alpha-amylase family glycosyl hydrolase [Lysobacter sp. LF1]